MISFDYSSRQAEEAGSILFRKSIWSRSLRETMCSHTADCILRHETAQKCDSILWQRGLSARGIHYSISRLEANRIKTGYPQFFSGIFMAIDKEYILRVVSGLRFAPSHWNSVIWKQRKWTHIFTDDLFSGVCRVVLFKKRESSKRYYWKNREAILEKQRMKRQN